MSMSEPGLTSASNNAKRAYVVPAGMLTAILLALGDVSDARAVGRVVGTRCLAVTSGGHETTRVALNAPV